MEQVPWSLLALLNVKHAVLVTPAWYANHTGADVRAIVNPLPVVPRIFLAAALHPVGSIQEGLGELFGGEELGRAPRIESRSVVEGLVTPPSVLASGGRVRATFRPGRIRVDLEPATEPRFVVLNELYHPDWHVYAGARRLGVYPTNVVMTGVLVPSGLDHLEFRFEPFVNMRTGAFFTAIAVVLTGITAWRLAGSDRRPVDSLAEAGRRGELP
jgi:hypothetical protein